MKASAAREGYGAKREGSNWRMCRWRPGPVSDETSEANDFVAATRWPAIWDLVPAENSSGEHLRRGHISKQGNSLLRFLLLPPIEPILGRVSRQQGNVGWTAQTIGQSEMALFPECMPSCAQIVLDTADIVRDGGYYANHGKTRRVWQAPDFPRS
jgi:hypothetical protein